METDPVNSATFVDIMTEGERQRRTLMEKREKLAKQEAGTGVMLESD